MDWQTDGQTDICTTDARWPQMVIGLLPVTTKRSRILNWNNHMLFSLIDRYIHFTNQLYSIIFFNLQMLNVIHINILYLHSTHITHVSTPIINCVLFRKQIVYYMCNSFKVLIEPNLNPFLFLVWQKHHQSLWFMYYNIYYMVLKY